MECVAGRRRRPRRLAREDKTIAAMIEMYCRDHHGAAGQCPDCAALLRYARLRLERCRYGESKPTCANCATHCYRPDMRERVRAVMRCSGPRMLRRHPVLALAHIADRRRTPQGEDGRARRQDVDAPSPDS